ncbi:MAG: F0F1 ATP synthase subunit gamma [Candidatus Paceibacterales bacterium]
MAKKFIFFKKQILEIENIGETVKALEKISAANVHNLKITSQRITDYEKVLKKIFCDMAEKHISHPLFRKIQTPKRLKVILTTERGLCGALLNQLLDFFQLSLKDYYLPTRPKKDKILVIGERGKKLLQERRIKIDYFFHGTKDIPKEEDTRKIKDFIISQFLAKKFNQVLIFYLEFETLAIQTPTFFSFLPFDKEKFKEEMGGEIRPISGYPIYEPNQKQIMDYLIKEYLGLVFYQKVLETKLSELSARTVAMEEAGQKAQKLINQLSRQYFRQKRETITKDINDLYAHRAIK